MVKDANGNLVGSVLSTSVLECGGTCAAVVARHFAEGVVASFNVNAGGADVATGLVKFETTDCTGTPYLDSSDTTLPRLVPAVQFVSDTVSATAYYATFPGSPHSISSIVRFTDQAGCATLGGTFTAPDRCCTAAGGGQSIVAPAGTLDWSPVLALTLPFHVEGP